METQHQAKEVSVVTVSEYEYYEEEEEENSNENESLKQLEANMMCGGGDTPNEERTSSHYTISATGSQMTANPFPSSALPYG